ncbi:MAG: hypothetical protein KAU90_03270 [Sulfurovaceae bacterium]|nr:hypothetical protein [Sulfurovaceae bacterium]
MIRFFLISFLTNITIFAGNIQDNQTNFPNLAWLILAISLISILFWIFYKALKSKNPKYGYLIALIIILIGGLLFV